MSKPVTITLRVLGGLVALLAILVLAALVILPSGWFREKVRARLMYEIERSTGGRVEIGAYNLDWKTLTAEVKPVVLPGTEPEGENPIVRMESLQVGIKIISLMERKFDISSLIIVHPEVNILVDKDGHTNFPEPKIKREKTSDPIQQILD